MRFSSSVLLGLVTLVSSIEAAITITAPAADAIVNPTEDFTISWASAPGDPAIIGFSLTCAGEFCAQVFLPIADNIPTSAGSTVIPANSIQNEGPWRIQVRSGGNGGTVLATSSVFTISSDINAVTTVTTTTPTGSDSTSTPGATTGITTNSEGSTVLTGTVTTTTPASTTVTSPSPTTPTSTTNAQPRLGGEGSGMFLTMAGVVAGLVALVA